MSISRKIIKILKRKKREKKCIQEERNGEKSTQQANETGMG